MLYRVSLIAFQEFKIGMRRPMVWVWIVLLGLLTWGMCAGGVEIGTGGDSRIGGTKQFLTSEFEFTRLMSAFTLIVHGFFATVLFGLTVLRDDESGIMPLLHSSKLSVTEYLVAKFSGCVMLVLVVLGLNMLLAMFFMYAVPSPARAEFFGPFVFGNFWKPMLKFVLPALLLLGGAAFALGTVFRKPILVFAFPIIFLLVFGLFLIFASPAWLPDQVNHLLCLTDPYGIRWMNETWFNVDQGADFYNTQPVILDTAFLFSRIGIGGLGFTFLLITIPVFRRQLLGSRNGSLAAGDGPLTTLAAATPAIVGRVPGLADLQMRQSKNGLIRDVWIIFRYELRELLHSPSMFLFIPFILLDLIATSLLAEGAFGTPMLHTSGSLRSAMESLRALGCLLMMFFTVESQMRERIRRLAPIYYSTPARSFAMLMGKSLANAGVCVVITAAALLASLVILLIQQVVPFELFPFVAYWVFLLMPTFVVWGSLVTLTIVATRSRYSTYAIGAVVLIGNLYFQQKGDLTWLTNWMIIDVAPWSDIAVFELDRSALWLNRLFYLSLAVLLTFVAARIFWRRGHDAVRLADRFRPKSIFRFALQSIPFLVLPVTLGSMLWSRIDYGHQGEAVTELEKKYWRQNFSTWAEIRPPSVSGVDVQLGIRPDQQHLEVQGTLRLTNDSEEPMRRFALTGGTHWREVAWQMGKSFRVADETPHIPDRATLVPAEPENRSGLYIFELNPPLEPGDSTVLGYSFQGRFPDGISKNGGDASEFVLPSGVVLTSFSNSFLPVPGFSKNVGLEEDDQPETKVYDDDFFEDQLKPLFGGGSQFHVRTTISGPADFTFNGVGIKLDDRLDGDRRTVVFESDSPVSFFNVVGGKWQVRKGETTEIYYSDKHPYNIDEISETLEQARAWYSRWFAPYPWRDLRLNEFPNMSTYAQGFPTNITFSEGIGFLTRNRPGADAPFLVTAHETAHQWWGNMLVPGEGPGGNILSEGMAHFSTGLLFDQVKGERARIDFFRLIEDKYGEDRSVDSERPMVAIDGSAAGDTTVMYDKGGWVFWMLLNHMGRTENLQGLQSFIRKYGEDRNDYPVLQDFVNHMRQFATDKKAYDEFVNQWFFEVVVPQYRLKNVIRQHLNGEWIINGTVTNIGSGAMPLEIAATTNDRFTGNDSNPDYRESRATVNIGADASVEFEIRCPFQPERVLVDPDAKVLQLKRKQAVHEFDD